MLLHLVAHRWYRWCFHSRNTSMVVLTCGYKPGPVGAIASLTSRAQRKQLIFGFTSKHLLLSLVPIRTC